MQREKDGSCLNHIPFSAFFLFLVSSSDDEEETYYQKKKRKNQTARWTITAACPFNKFKWISYLCSHVFTRRWAHKRETNEEHISLGVRERTQSVVIFLTSCIPQTQVDWLSVNHYIGRVVIKTGR